jgi:hypothetical protein
MFELTKAMYLLVTSSELSAATGELHQLKTLASIYLRQVDQKLS